MIITKLKGVIAIVQQPKKLQMKLEEKKNIQGSTGFQALPLLYWCKHSTSSAVKQVIGEAGKFDELHNCNDLFLFNLCVAASSISLS